MGDCHSKAANDAAELDKHINNELKRSKVEEKSILKLLLLGAGESGKSTIFKQLRVLHNRDFSDDERRSYARLVKSNLFDNLRNIYKGIEENCFPLDDEAKEGKDFAESFSLEAMPFDDQVADRVAALWANPTIQDAFTKRSKFQLDDSAAYFFEHVKRISDPNYAATNQDIFHTRVRTTGIHEIEFVLEGVHFRLTDVGGQRNERRKWIHCFEDVTAVVFVAAISEYDQVLFEDNKTNRMTEALDLFEEIANSRWFAKTAMILFLNKEDLFKQKLKNTPLDSWYPEYTGGGDYEAAVKFMEELFTSKCEDIDKQIYVHPTCATNTGNIRFVFDTVKDIVLEYNVIDSGMM